MDHSAPSFSQPARRSKNKSLEPRFHIKIHHIRQILVTCALRRLAHPRSANEPAESILVVVPMARFQDLHRQDVKLLDNTQHLANETTYLLRSGLQGLEAELTLNRHVQLLPPRPERVDERDVEAFELREAVAQCVHHLAGRYCANFGCHESSEFRG